MASVLAARPTTLRRSKRPFRFVRASSLKYSTWKPSERNHRRFWLFAKGPPWWFLMSQPSRRIVNSRPAIEPRLSRPAFNSGSEKLTVLLPLRKS